MTHNSGKRTPLSLVAIRTHKTLFWFVSGASLLLFVTALFLMNHLSMAGYILSRETENNHRLKAEQQQLDAQVAKIQTQEFVHKTSDKTAMVVEKYRQFVVVPATFTAQK